MAKNYTAGDEPVPGTGYRLAEFLGRGGFGEVWKAHGPGGVEVALKIIHLGGVAGRKEFRALQLVKRIHHPNAVPIVAFWLKAADGSVLDDDYADWEELAGESGRADAIKATAIAPPDLGKTQAAELVIAMGLGDISLFDRMRQCQGQGRAGIGEDELLGYLESAAKAIDYLNSPIHDLGGGATGGGATGGGLVAIQHCDIKPQNILIVGNATQVCDFGLARMMGTERATTTAATIAYAAPECLSEGNPSDTTDQYSLAVSYYELRTGKLPYDNEAPGAVMDAKLNETLNFSAVSPAQQTVLCRAASRDPAARFATSSEMIAALRKTAGGGLDQTTVYEGPASTPKRPRRAAKFFAVAVLLSIGGAAVWFFTLPEPSKLALPRPDGPPTIPASPLPVDGRPVDEQQVDESLLDGPSINVQPVDGLESSRALLKTGKESLAKQDYSTALSNFATALLLSNNVEPSGDPDFFDALRDATAEAYLARGDQTLKRCEKEFIDEEGRPDTGLAAMESWRSAIDDFTEAIKYSPQNPLAFSRRGRAYFRLKNWKKATENIIKAVELQPHVGDYMRLGQICEELDDAQGALAAHLRAVKTDPQNANANYLLGNIYFEIERYADAIDPLKKAADLYEKAGNTRNLVEALHLRAGSLLEEGRGDEALRDIAWLVELDPSENAYYAELCYETADAYAGLKDFKSAVKWAEKAVEFVPDDAKKNEYQKNLEAYRKEL